MYTIYFCQNNICFRKTKIEFETYTAESDIKVGDAYLAYIQNVFIKSSHCTVFYLKPKDKIMNSFKNDLYYTLNDVDPTFAKKVMAGTFSSLKFNQTRKKNSVQFLEVFG